MLPPPPTLRPEDWARLVSYTIGVTWAIVFSLWIPSSYAGVVTTTLVHAWSLLSGAGCLVAAIGTLLRRDLKVELPAVYVVEVGSLLYLVAQIGFAAGPQWLDRLPLFIFIAWHMSLLAPRIVGLESYRRRVRLAVKGLS